MERLLVLRLEVANCTAQASLNGIPLIRSSGARANVTLPVHEFTLAGANELALEIGPALPGQPAAPAARLSDGQTGASLRLLLPRVGSVADAAHARCLAQLEWAPARDEPYETPTTLQTQVDLPIQFPRWRWLDVLPVEVDARLTLEAARYLTRIVAAMARGDVDPLLMASRLRLEEQALAYQRDLTETVASARTQLAAICAGGAFKPRLVSPPELLLRPVAGGRLLECLRADGGPAIQGTLAEGHRFEWPARLTRVDGALYVLR